MIRDHPWLGVGYGAFAQVYPGYLDPATVGIRVPETPAQLHAAHAHNEILAVASAAGIPAAGAYMALVVLALVTALQYQNRRAAPALAALIALAVHGVFDAVAMTFAGPLVVFWFVLAAAVQPGGDPRENRGDHLATA
jgi:O-antigen ligase